MKYFFKKSSILIVLLLLLSVNYSYSNNLSKNQPDGWQLVYENNKDGKAVNSDIKQLIEAIKNGKEVRVVTLAGDNYTTAFNAENIWIKNGIVYIQNTQHISVKFKEDKLLVKKDAYHWYVILSSKGDRTMSRWSVGAHLSRGNNQDKVALRWFVK